MTATTTPVPNRGTQADVLLLDGTVGAVRPVDRSDLEALLELHDGLGEDALRLRFFGISRIPPQRYVDHVLGGVESDAVLGLGLWQHGRLLGVATAELDASSVRAILTQNAVEQSRLATTIGSDHAEDLAVVKVERHVDDCPYSAKGLREVANRDDDLLIGELLGSVVNRGHDVSPDCRVRRRFCNLARSWLNDPATPLGATTIMTTTNKPNQTR